MVAGRGFEPPDLRVMSPTSYRTAPPRDTVARDTVARDTVARDTVARIAAARGSIAAQPGLVKAKRGRGRISGGGAGDGARHRGDIPCEQRPNGR